MADSVNLSEANYNGDYSSEFDEHEAKRTWRDDDISGVKRKANSTSGLPSKKFMNDEHSRAEGVNQRYHFLALDAYTRHKKMINDYLLFYGPGVEAFARDSSRDKTDLDILKQEHRFIWDEEEDSDSTWERRLAKKYYDKLFREYCIADLSKYKENKIALRWRIEKEVIEGKGQFICGNKRCQESEGLKSWEVNFAYEEQGERKNTLIKLRLCPDCTFKLNYHHQRKLAKQNKKEEKRREKYDKKKKKKRKHKDRKHNSKSSSSEGEMSGSEDQSPATKDTKSNDSKPSKDDSKPSSSTEENIWKGPAKVLVDKSREEEFEEYFQDMFL